MSPVIRSPDAARMRQTGSSCASDRSSCHHRLASGFWCQARESQTYFARVGCFSLPRTWQQGADRARQLPANAFCIPGRRACLSVPARFIASSSAATSPSPIVSRDSNSFYALDYAQFAVCVFQLLAQFGRVRRSMNSVHAWIVIVRTSATEA